MIGERNFGRIRRPSAMSIVASVLNKRLPAQALATLCLLTLPGCAGFQVHNETRSKLASDGRQAYADAKVVEAVEAERKNLDLLLSEEIKVVRENHRLQVDFALLEIANNSTPMAGTYVEAMGRIDRLGFDSIHALRKLLSGAVINRSTQATLDTFARVFEDAGVAAPPCGELPDKPPSVADPLKQKRLESLYPRYRALCAKSGAPPVPPTGLLADAHREWSAASSALERKARDQQTARNELAAAKKKYDEAVVQSAEPGQKAKDWAPEFTKRAQELAKLVEKAKDLDAGIENNEYIEALVNLLTAAAGGQVNPESPGVKRAAEVARQIPSLAEQLGELQARRAALPVTGLLLALRHQTVLLQAAKRRVALAEERVAILKARYDAYYDEARQLLRFTDALCSYAVLGANPKQKHPGSRCDQFIVSNAAAPVCRFDGIGLQNCALEAAWKDRLTGQDPPDVKRELHKAIAAYLQALGLQARPMEERYREIDVRHREMLVAKQSALEAWDNLVSAPLEQLDAYYKAGIRPAEIADLIVKALGFTAIAIGVAQ